MSYSLNYVVRQSKVNRKGIAPIELTISVDGKRVFMSLPYKCTPTDFKASMSSKRKNDIKNFCSAYSGKVQNTITAMIQQGIDITAANIKSYLSGEYNKVYTVGDLFNDFYKYLGKRIDVDVTMDNYLKYRLIKDLVYEIIDKDTDVNSLNAIDAQNYITLIKSRFINGTCKYKFAKFKCILKYGVDSGKVKVNILDNVKVKFDKPKGIKYLTNAELDKLKTKDLHNDRLNKVRDLFLFQCYTGMAYKDMSCFSKSDIRDMDGQKVIVKTRCKTDIEFTIVLLPNALDLLEKYDYQLPVISNQRYNSYLKEIADLCGIDKQLTTHMGRHTAACQLLNAGVRMEVVSKVLGHSSTKITESTYAKMFKSTIIDEVVKHM